MASNRFEPCLGIRETLIAQGPWSPSNGRLLGLGLLLALITGLVFSWAGSELWKREAASLRQAADLHFLEL